MSSENKVIPLQEQREKPVAKLDLLDLDAIHKVLQRAYYSAIDAQRTAENAATKASCARQDLYLGLVAIEFEMAELQERLQIPGTTKFITRESGWNCPRCHNAEVADADTICSNCWEKENAR